MRVMPADIEKTYSLDERADAVVTLANALAYIRGSRLPFIDRVNTAELLRDGIKNALDHRATGREFRTLRHRVESVQDQIQVENLSPSAAEEGLWNDLEADRERLEEMERLHDAGPWPDTDTFDDGQVIKVWVVTRSGEHKTYGTLREAIDAAREAAKG